MSYGMKKHPLLYTKLSLTDLLSVKVSFSLLKAIINSNSQLIA